nr:GNAT family N-acetyltransferase [Halorussus salinus]
MLDVRADLRERIAVGDVLVAREPTREETADCVETADRETPILGALVLVRRNDAEEDAAGDDATHGDDAIHADATHDDTAHVHDAHIDAVAVRRARRGQGIGSALVRAAAERHARLTAEFDPGVRPFYDALDFSIAPVEGDSDRLRGRYGGEG